LGGFSEDPVRISARGQGVCVNENEKLKKENMEAQIKLKDMLDLYEKTIDKAIYLTKRSLPLHRQLKNVYKQRRDCQVEIRRLKA
jgi:hypothetical protein